MNKKWLIAIIVAVVVILIAIPAGIILKIHNSEYDCSFEYRKVEDIVSEIARKHTYYDAANKTVEVSLDQDLINSLIVDLMGSMDLGLPDNIQLKQVFLNTKDRRIYINAKYGALNTPLSARINVDIQADGLVIKADSLKLANMNAPGFVKNQIPAEVLTYNIKYADLGIPVVFGVKDVKFGSGNITVLIELYEDKIADLAVSYRDDILNEINKAKANQSGTVATFLDKLAASEALSEAKFREYVKTILNDGELVNSAIYFATAEDLGKYSKSLESGQEKLMAWLDPIMSIKFEGSIDEIVTNIIEDEKLKDLASWFVSRDKIDEYTSTVKDYTTKYTAAMTSFNDITAKLTSGDIDGAVTSLTRKDEIKNFLGLFLDRAEIDKYASDIDKYYSMYNNVLGAFKGISDDVNNGDYDAAINRLVSDSALKDFIAMFVDRATVDQYANDVKEYYTKFNNVLAALDGVSAAVNDGDIERAINTLKDNTAVQEFLALFVDSDIVGDIAKDIEEYYGIYNTAMNTLNDITAAINTGDIDTIISKIVDNKELEEFLALFLDQSAIDEYLAEVEKYYQMYQDYLAQVNEAIASFEAAVAAIDTEAIKANVESFKAQVAAAKDVQQFLLDQVDLIDTEGLKELAALWESDTGVIKDTLAYYEPTWEETVKFINAADETKTSLRKAILDMDLSSVDEINAIADDWCNFTVKLVEMLQDKKYAELADMVANNNFSDPEMKAFIDKYSSGDVELTAFNKMVTDLTTWWADMANLYAKLASGDYEGAYEIFSEKYVKEAGPRWAFRR